MLARSVLGPVHNNLKLSNLQNHSVQSNVRLKVTCQMSTKPDSAINSVLSI